MKKCFVIVFIILALCLQASGTAVNAAAVSGYGRVLKDGVIMYSDTALSEDSALFTLTKTYYIYIFDINTTDDYYTVEYQKAENGYVNISGFVRKSDVTVWPSPNAPYYPEITATIINSTNLYSRPDMHSDTIVYIPKGPQVLKLYGSMHNAEENALYYYCIYFGGRDGYIPAANIDITLPPAHSDPMPTPPPTLTPPPTTDGSNPNPQTSNNPMPVNKDGILQIILIAAICIPALIIVYLMFRPAKKSRKNYPHYYGDDDDESG